jgi:hypothetical protein
MSPPEIREKVVHMPPRLRSMPAIAVAGMSTRAVPGPTTTMRLAVRM